MIINKIIYVLIIVTVLFLILAGVVNANVNYCDEITLQKVNGVNGDLSKVSQKMLPPLTGAFFYTVKR